MNAIAPLFITLKTVRERSLIDPGANGAYRFCMNPTAGILALPVHKNVPHLIFSFVVLERKTWLLWGADIYFTSMPKASSCNKEKKDLAQFPMLLTLLDIAKIKCCRTPENKLVLSIIFYLYCIYWISFQFPYVLIEWPESGIGSAEGLSKLWWALFYYLSNMSCLDVWPLRGLGESFRWNTSL